jgi:heme exporter protein B
VNQNIRQVALLVAKDLRLEARTRQTLGLVIVLGLLIVVVLGLALPRLQDGGLSAPAIVWVAYLFGGVLVFEKTMSVERYDGALEALLLAPLDRSAIYAAKLIGNLLLMLALAAVVTPVAMILFGLDLSPAPFGFVAVIGLSMIGFGAVGTLFAAVTTSSRLQGGLLAMLVFPVALPLVIASTQLLTHLFRDHQALSAPGLAVLAAFDGIFLAVSWLVFELVLEP